MGTRNRYKTRGWSTKTGKMVSMAKVEGKAGVIRMYVQRLLSNILTHNNSTRGCPCQSLMHPTSIQDSMHSSELLDPRTAARLQACSSTAHVGVHVTVDTIQPTKHAIRWGYFPWNNSKASSLPNVSRPRFSSSLSLLHCNCTQPLAITKTLSME